MTGSGDKSVLSRRSFIQLPVVAGSAAVVASATGCGEVEGDAPADEAFGVPIPPSDAKVVTTACDYCIVGCSYKALIWKQGIEGGTRATENALGEDFPVSMLSGAWISPNMHTVVEIEGEPHNVVVMPDAETQVVNVGGDHSVRGGTLAQKLYARDRKTAERLQAPRLRVGESLVEISWDDALHIMAEVSKHVIQRHGAEAWGIKHYSYQYYENTYALTKLALGAIETPTWSVHDKPQHASDTPGLTDAGVNAFSASYQDWADAEVLVVSGVSLYDTKSILFQQWVEPRGGTLIVINPRRDLTADYAVKHGGLHLQLIPGTDTVLNNAIARVIVERGWQDQEFIDEWTASAGELGEESSERRLDHGLVFSEYAAFLLADEACSLEQAERITGVPRKDIERAAELMARPRPQRPKTSVMLEKGNYWGYNYENTASIASLGLLVGAGNRPGRVISRAGGHQRGMLKAAPYPLHNSPHKRDGKRVPVNVDRAAFNGDVRFMWVVGTTWLAAMAASEQLANRVHTLTRDTGPQLDLDDARVRDGKLVDVARVVGKLCERVDAGGMVLAQQEIYENALSECASLILPAAAWGEENFTRMQGERRLRHYGKIMDPPGNARPDWWIVAQVGTRMGYEGFDWEDANAVFEEASEKSVGTAHDYRELVLSAKRKRMRGHDLLRGLGTTGIQCPIRLDDAGELEGTVRLHENEFSTDSGKAVFVRGDWAHCRPIQEATAPTGQELWITNMRLNQLWQSMHDDSRIPFRSDRFPANILELHPDDAATRFIRDGDWVRITNHSVIGYDGSRISGSYRAVAYLTDATRKGVACTYFNYKGRVDMAANTITSAEVDARAPVYRYKLSKGLVECEGESEYKHSMSFCEMNRVS